jgi:hypothetical protein
MVKATIKPRVEEYILNTQHSPAEKNNVADATANHRPTDPYYREKCAETVFKENPANFEQRIFICMIFLPS